MLAGSGILRDGHPADRLDLLQAERAVGAGAGEDDADGPLLLILSQRAEEEVDRHADPAPLQGRGEAQDTLADAQVLVRGMT